MDALSYAEPATLAYDRGWVTCSHVLLNGLTCNRHGLRPRSMKITNAEMPSCRITVSKPSLHGSRDIIQQSLCLPTELWEMVAEYLNYKNIVNLRATCRYLKLVIGGYALCAALKRLEMDFHNSGMHRCERIWNIVDQSLELQQAFTSLQDVGYSRQEVIHLAEKQPYYGCMGLQSHIYFPIGSPNFYMPRNASKTLRDLHNKGCYLGSDLEHTGTRLCDFCFFYDGNHIPLLNKDNPWYLSLDSMSVCCSKCELTRWTGYWQSDLIYGDEVIDARQFRARMCKFCWAKDMENQRWSRNKQQLKKMAKIIESCQRWMIAWEREDAQPDNPSNKVPSQRLRQVQRMAQKLARQWPAEWEWAGVPKEKQESSSPQLQSVGC